MNKVEVFFDFVEMGNSVYVGSVVKEDDEVIGSKAEIYPKKEGFNHFHYSMVAWRLGIRNVREVFEDDDVYDKVVFKNQNGLIFKWARKGECPKEYSDLLSYVYDEVTNLLSDFEVSFSFFNIKGKENVVKKMLKKRLDKGNFETQCEEELGFAGLKSVAMQRNKKAVGESSGKNNVVEMRKKK